MVKASNAVERMKTRAEFRVKKLCSFSLPFVRASRPAIPWNVAWKLVCWSKIAGSLWRNAHFLICAAYWAGSYLKTTNELTTEGAAPAAENRHGTDFHASVRDLRHKTCTAKQKNVASFEGWKTSTDETKSGFAKLGFETKLCLREAQHLLVLRVDVLRLLVMIVILSCCFFFFFSFVFFSLLLV